MATSTISGANQTLLRSVQWIDGASLFVTPLTSVFTATINSVPTRFPYVSLTLSATVTGVSVGMMWRVTDGTSIVSQGVVSKAPSGSTLYISQTPLGAAGFATNIEQAIEVGQTVTVYTHRPLWSLYSRIAQKTFFKIWDLAYTDQNEVTQPVANTGAWQAGVLQSGASTYRFTLPLRGVNESWSVGSLVAPTTEWVLPAGVSFVAGYDEFDGVVEVDAEAGTHLISLIATRSGRTHTAYMWLFVTGGSDSVAVSNGAAIAIESDNQNRLGRVMKFRVFGSDWQSTFYPGAGILFKEHANYNGQALSAGVGIDSFIGYVAEIESQHDGNIPSILVTVESPMIYAARLAQPSQSLTEVTEAARWTECESLFSNPQGFMYYLIKWHSPSLMDMHDLDVPYNEPRRKYLEVNNKNLQANLSVIADYIAGNLGSASDGTTVLRKNPLYMSNADRNAVDTLLTFLDEDVKAPFTYYKRMYNAYSDIRVGAFAFAGTKPKVWYAGKRWAQGSGATEMPNVTVTATEGLTRLKEIAGHYAAEQNAEIQEIGIDLLRNQDVIDPAYMLWYALTIPANFDSYAATGFSISRLLATEITRDWEIDNGGLKKRIRLTGQLETFGQAGEELPVGNVKGISQGGYSFGVGIDFAPNTSSGMFGGSQSVSSAFVLSVDGLFAMTQNYFTQSPQWIGLNAALSGETVNDFDFDYNSAFFAEGRNPAASLGMYVVTIDVDEAHIWYFDDILRSTFATLLASLTLSDETITTEARIKCSETYPLLVLAGFKDGTGTRYSRSTDGGATFGSLTRVGSVIADTSINDNAPLGLWVDGQRQLISAPNASAEYGTYFASTAAGSFSKLASSQDSSFPQKAISIEPSGTYAYVSSAEGFAGILAFDGSDTISAGDPSTTANRYQSLTDTTGGSVITSDGIAASGNPGNCYRWAGTSFFTTDNVQLQISMPSFPALSTLRRIKFDVYFDFPSANLGVRTPTTASGDEVVLSNAQKNQWITIDSDDYPVFDLPEDHDDIFILFLPKSVVGAAWEIRVDNIETDVLIEDKLWRVTDFAGTPSWTNISPSTGEAPEVPNSIAVDVVNAQTINLFSGLGTDWYRSTNRGSSWTTFANNSPYRAIFTLGNQLIVGGIGEQLAVSFDSGTTLNDITGDLESVWNSFPAIKKTLVI